MCVFVGDFYLGFLLLFVVGGFSSCFFFKIYFIRLLT